MSENSRRAIGVLLLALSPHSSAQFQRSPGASIDEAARATAPSQARPQPDSPTEAKVLSDVKGFQIQPYLSTVSAIVRRNWFSAIHEVVNNPERRNGKVVADLIITRSGEIRDIQIVSPSGEEDLDEAVSLGLNRANSLPALPKTLSRDELKLRFSFYYKESKNSRWWKRH